MSRMSMFRDENFDENKILIAQPNISNLITEVQKEVANSPAFQCLEENFYHGKISGTEMAMLKMKFAEHYNSLTRTRDNEYNLLQMSKRFIAILEVQNSELSKSDHFPENISTTVSRLRCEHLRTENTLMATEERVEKLKYQLELQNMEKKMLQREFSRMPKSELDQLGEEEDIIEAMLRRTKTLTIENQELSIESDKLRRERHKLVDILKNSIDHENEIKEEQTQMLAHMDKVKSDLFMTNQLPGQYSKEYEKLRRYKSEADKELVQANELHNQLKEETVVMTKKLSELLSTMTETINKSRASAREKLELGRATDELTKNTLLLRAHEMELRTDKAGLESSLQACVTDKYELTMNIAKALKERDKLVKDLKSSQLHMSIAQEMLFQTRQIYDKEKLRYQMFPMYDSTFMERREKLGDDVGQLKVALEEEAGKGDKTIVKVQQAVSESERRLFVLDNHRSECVELSKLAIKMADRREKAAIEYLKAERRHRRISDEIEVKDLLLLQQKKELDILNNKAASVARLYSEVKMERNKCVALLQLTNQNHLLFKERLKLRLNEQSITLYHLNGRNSQLDAQAKDIQRVIIVRDNMRTEICRWQAIQIDQTNKREEMRLNICSLNSLFNRIEGDIIATKKLTEKNILFRNERAMQLIERNEDVFILDERIKLQESRNHNAQIELQGLFEEKNCLGRYKSQLVDMIELFKKQMPTRESLHNQSLQMLEEFKTNRINLNRQIQNAEDPTAPGRLRLLKGKDLDPEQMRKKVHQVEDRLINKEEQMLEKDLLYEAVSRLVDQVQLRTNIGKDDTIKVAKTINHMKNRLLQVDKLLKVNAAELTIKMTNTYSLLKDAEDHNHSLNRKYDRLERGLAPSDLERKLYNRQKTHKAIREEYKRTKHIKKKIQPNHNNFPTVRWKPNSPEYRLPPIASRIHREPRTEKYLTKTQEKQLEQKILIEKHLSSNNSSDWMDSGRFYEVGTSSGLSHSNSGHKCDIGPHGGYNPSSMGFMLTIVPHNRPTYEDNALYSHSASSHDTTIL